MKIPETTKELFDEYFKTLDEGRVKKTRGQVDRHEVYAFERKINKKLIEMNPDELFQMMLTFTDNRRCSKSNAKVSNSSYNQICSSYRAIFRYYIENYEIIRNPFDSPKLKGNKAIELLMGFKEPYTLDKVESTIQKVHDAYEYNKAKYIECIIRLFYEGFAKAEEIADLTEDMIDFKGKSIRLPGRTIQLSDRCFELLTFVRNMTELEGWHENYLVVSWRDRYFKHIIRPKEAKAFNDRTIKEMANSINRRLLVDVKQKFDNEMNYRNLYLLGFYNYVIKRVGEDRAAELVMLVRDSESVEELRRIARDYGIMNDNISNLKRVLTPFVTKK